MGCFGRGSMAPLTIFTGSRGSKVHIREKSRDMSRDIIITTNHHPMPLQQPRPMPRPIPRNPRAHAPPPPPAPPGDHTAYPSSSSTQSPHSDDPLMRLSKDLAILIALLFQKLAQSPSIYDHNATKAEILHHRIRKVMRRVREHPEFSEIENDIKEELFQITWGALETESERWGKGPGLRQDRGRVAREQRVVRRVLRDWGVDDGDVYGAVEDDKGKEGPRGTRSGEKEQITKEARSDVYGALDHNKGIGKAMTTNSGGKTRAIKEARADVDCAFEYKKGKEEARIIRTGGKKRVIKEAKADVDGALDHNKGKEKARITNTGGEKRVIKYAKANVDGVYEDDKGKQVAKAAETGGKRRAIREAKADVDGAYEDDEGKEVANAMKTGGKERVNREAKGRMAAFKGVVDDLCRDGRFKARQARGSM